MSEHAASRVDVEHSTTMAVQEKKKLQKSLRRFDMLFFTVCALVGLDTLGQVSGFGAQTFTWLIVLAVFFVLPYALLMAELGSAFTQEGGPYEWMKLCWGRFWAGIGAVLYWITNPLWVGGSLAFISTQAWSSNISQIGTGTVGDYFFKLVFIWVSITVAIVSLRRGKWIPNVGAIVRVVVLGFFSITVLIYGIKHGDRIQQGRAQHAVVHHMRVGLARRDIAGKVQEHRPGEIAPPEKSVIFMAAIGWASPASADHTPRASRTRLTPAESANARLSSGTANGRRSTRATRRPR